MPVQVHVINEAAVLRTVKPAVAVGKAQHVVIQMPCCRARCHSLSLNAANPPETNADGLAFVIDFGRFATGFYSRPKR